MTSGCSWHDIRRAKIAICSVLGFGCHQQRQLLWWVSLQINLPAAAPTMPPCPLSPPQVAWHPPAHTGQLGKGGPTSSALAVGRLHLDGAVHLQHTSGSGQSVAVPCPP